MIEKIIVFVLLKLYEIIKWCLLIGLWIGIVVGLAMLIELIVMLIKLIVMLEIMLLIFTSISGAILLCCIGYGIKIWIESNLRTMERIIYRHKEYEMSWWQAFKEYL